MNFIMKSKFLKILIPTVFWCLVWQVLARIVSNDYFLPDIKATASALFTLLSTVSFYKAVIFSLFRVVIGLCVGVIVGVILAIISNKSEFVLNLISPIISVIKSTPVATFIVLLWVVLSGDMLSIFMQLERIPLGPISLAIDLDSPISPAFEAE